MKEAKQSYDLIKELYQVLGRRMPNEEEFSLSGITITIDSDKVEISERGMALKREPLEIKVEISAPRTYDPNSFRLIPE